MTSLKHSFMDKEKILQENHCYNACLQWTRNDMYGICRIRSVAFIKLHVIIAKYETEHISHFSPFLLCYRNGKIICFTTHFSFKKL